MLTPEERAQLIAAQAVEHIRQAILPLETNWRQITEFLLNEVDGVYVTVGDETRTIPSSDLAEVPIKDWALMARSHRGQITQVPVADVAPKDGAEPEPATEGGS